LTPELSRPGAGELVLVTGGCGFIGANLVRRLIEEGWRVRVLDDLSTGSRESIAGLPLEVVQGDICQAEVAEAAVQGCAAVVHLAAATSVLDSVANPLPTFRTNAGGTLSLLQACHLAGVKRFILASSNAALGPHDPPLDELKLPRPASPYGASKLAAEGYCQAYWGSHGLCTVILRFANVYGPYSTHKTSVVAKFIRRLLAGQTLTIYGDGQQTRDLIHVDDIARAIVLALRCAAPGELFQVGTGVETTVMQLVELLGAVSGRTPKLEYLPQPAGEIRRNYAAIGKAERLLGFRATVPLLTGLRVTYAWLAAQAKPAVLER